MAHGRGWGVRITPAHCHPNIICTARSGGSGWSAIGSEDSPDPSQNSEDVAPKARHDHRKYLDILESIKMKILQRT
jgi:hypothetical protein